jgi:dolichol kinase
VTAEGPGAEDRGPGTGSRAAAPAPAPAAPAPSSLSLRHELARKALHLTSATVPLAYAAGVPREPLLALLVVLLVAALLVELTRRRVQLVRRAFQATHPLLRAHEHERVAGATWLLLAFVLAVWLCPRATAVAATWAVSVGDAAAAVVGRWVGRRRRGAHGKSLEGSLACVGVTALGALLVAGLAPGTALVAGVAAALAEWPARPLDDNLRVAGAVAAAVTAAEALHLLA